MLFLGCPYINFNHKHHEEEINFLKYKYVFEKLALLKVLNVFNWSPQQTLGSSTLR